MTNRLDILKASLDKKTAKLDALIQAHFDTVKQANGQPLNDKRNGHATLNKWQKQNDAIARQQAETEKTKRAIEAEEYKIRKCEAAVYPACFEPLITDGTLVQWRKYPNRFFVRGVDKARIIWDDKKGLLNSYYKAIPNQEQQELFKAVWYRLKDELDNQSTT